MATMEFVLTAEEEKWLDEASEAQLKGDIANFKRLLRKVPLDPSVAWAAKQVCGAKALLEEGFNLSWANKKFGDDWLEK